MGNASCGLNQPPYRADTPSPPHSPPSHAKKGDASASGSGLAAATTTVSEKPSGVREVAGRKPLPFIVKHFGKKEQRFHMIIVKKPPFPFDEITLEPAHYWDDEGARIKMMHGMDHLIGSVVLGINGRCVLITPFSDIMQILRDDGSAGFECLIQEGGSFEEWFPCWSVEDILEHMKENSATLQKQVWDHIEPAGKRNGDGIVSDHSSGDEAAHPAIATSHSLGVAGSSSAYSTQKRKHQHTNSDSIHQRRPSQSAVLSPVGSSSDHKSEDLRFQSEEYASDGIRRMRRKSDSGPYPLAAMSMVDGRVRAAQRRDEVRKMPDLHKPVYAVNQVRDVFEYLVNHFREVYARVREPITPGGFGGFSAAMESRTTSFAVSGINAGMHNSNPLAPFHYLIEKEFRRWLRIYNVQFKELEKKKRNEQSAWLGLRDSPLFSVADYFAFAQWLLKRIIDTSNAQRTTLLHTKRELSSARRARKSHRRGGRTGMSSAGGGTGGGTLMMSGLSSDSGDASSLAYYYNLPPRERQAQALSLYAESTASGMLHSGHVHTYFHVYRPQLVAMLADCMNGGLESTTNRVVDTRPSVVIHRSSHAKEGGPRGSGHSAERERRDIDHRSAEDKADSSPSLSLIHGREEGTSTMMLVNGQAHPSMIHRLFYKVDVYGRNQIEGDAIAVFFFLAVREFAMNYSRILRERRRKLAGSPPRSGGVSGTSALSAAAATAAAAGGAGGSSGLSVIHQSHHHTAPSKRRKAGKPGGNSSQHEYDTDLSAIRAAQEASSMGHAASAVAGGPSSVRGTGVSSTGVRADPLCHSASEMTDRVRRQEKREVRQGDFIDYGQIPVDGFIPPSWSQVRTYILRMYEDWKKTTMRDILYISELIQLSVQLSSPMRSGLNLRYGESDARGTVGQQSLHSTDPGIAAGTKLSGTKHAGSASLSRKKKKRRSVEMLTGGDGGGGIGDSGAAKAAHINHHHPHHSTSKRRPSGAATADELLLSPAGGGHGRRKRSQDLETTRSHSTRIVRTGSSAGKRRGVKKKTMVMMPDTSSVTPGPGHQAMMSGSSMSNQGFTQQLFVESPAQAPSAYPSGIPAGVFFDGGYASGATSYGVHRPGPATATAGHRTTTMGATPSALHSTALTPGFHSSAAHTTGVYHQTPAPGSSMNAGPIPASVQQQLVYVPEIGSFAVYQQPTPATAAATAYGAGPAAAMNPHALGMTPGMPGGQVPPGLAAQQGPHLASQSAGSLDPMTAAYYSANPYGAHPAAAAAGAGQIYYPYMQGTQVLPGIPSGRSWSDSETQSTLTITRHGRDSKKHHRHRHRRRDSTRTSSLSSAGSYHRYRESRRKRRASRDRYRSSDEYYSRYGSDDYGRGGRYSKRHRSGGDRDRRDHHRRGGHTSRHTSSYSGSTMSQSESVSTSETEESSMDSRLLGTKKRRHRDDSAGRKRGHKHSSETRGDRRSMRRVRIKDETEDHPHSPVMMRHGRNRGSDERDPSRLDQRRERRRRRGVSDVMESMSTSPDYAQRVQRDMNHAHRHHHGRQHTMKQEPAVSVGSSAVVPALPPYDAAHPGSDGDEAKTTIIKNEHGRVSDYGEDFEEEDEDNGVAVTAADVASRDRGSHQPGLMNTSIGPEDSLASIRKHRSSLSQSDAFQDADHINAPQELKNTVSAALGAGHALLHKGGEDYDDNDDNEDDDGLDESSVVATLTEPPELPALETATSERQGPDSATTAATRGAASESHSSVSASVAAAAKDPASQEEMIARLLRLLDRRELSSEQLETLFYKHFASPSDALPPVPAAKSMDTDLSDEKIVAASIGSDHSREDDFKSASVEPLEGGVGSSSVIRHRSESISKRNLGRMLSGDRLRSSLSDLLLAAFSKQFKPIRLYRHNNTNPSLVSSGTSNGFDCHRAQSLDNVFKSEHSRASSVPPTMPPTLPRPHTISAGAFKELKSEPHPNTLKVSVDCLLVIIESQLKRQSLYFDEFMHLADIIRAYAVRKNLSLPQDMPRKRVYIRRMSAPVAPRMDLMMMGEASKDDIEETDEKNLDDGTSVGGGNGTDANTSEKVRVPRPPVHGDDEDHNQDHHEHDSVMDVDSAAVITGLDAEAVRSGSVLIPDERLSINLSLVDLGDYLQNLSDDSLIKLWNEFYTEQYLSKIVSPSAATARKRSYRVLRYVKFFDVRYLVEFLAYRYIREVVSPSVTGECASTSGGGALSPSDRRESTPSYLFNEKDINHLVDQVVKCIDHYEEFVGHSPPPHSRTGTALATAGDVLGLTATQKVKREGLIRSLSASRLEQALKEDRLKRERKRKAALHHSMVDVTAADDHTHHHSDDDESSDSDMDSESLGSEIMNDEQLMAGSNASSGSSGDTHTGVSRTSHQSRRERVMSELINKYAQMLDEDIKNGNVCFENTDGIHTYTLYDFLRMGAVLSMIKEIDSEDDERQNELDVNWELFSSYIWSKQEVLWDKLTKVGKIDSSNRVNVTFLEPVFRYAIRFYLKYAERYEYVHEHDREIRIYAQILHQALIAQRKGHHASGGSPTSSSKSGLMKKKSSSKQSNNVGISRFQFFDFVQQLNSTALPS